MILSSSLLVHDLQSFGLDNVGTKWEPWRQGGMETGVLMSDMGAEKPLSIVWLMLPNQGRDRVVECILETGPQSKARRECDISRKPPGWV